LFRTRRSVPPVLHSFARRLRNTRALNRSYPLRFRIRASPHAFAWRRLRQPPCLPRFPLRSPREALLRRLGRGRGRLLMGSYFLEPLHCQTNPIRSDNIRDPSLSPGP
jgi:hypothetical protein